MFDIFKTIKKDIKKLIKKEISNKLEIKITEFFGNVRVDLYYDGELIDSHSTKIN